MSHAESPWGRTADAWSHLAGLTQARIALGRAGSSLPTRPMLDFKLAHARARDAVHLPFHSKQLADDIQALGSEVLLVGSAARDRGEYLRRPDLGRRLSSADHARLRDITSPGGCDLALIVSDGLSALAAHRQAVPTLASLLPLLKTSSWRLAPIIIAGRGRVALEDEIGEILGATIALILIGERPGLGTPDSLGAYMVYQPCVGRTDAERNCVSNIRTEGLPPARAAAKLHYLLNLARQHQISGVALKDRSDLLQSENAGSPPLSGPQR